MGFYCPLFADERQALELAGRKKILTLKDASWQVLSDLVKKGVMNKIPPQEEKQFWPHYRISRRGRSLLKSLRATRKQLSQKG